MKFENISHFSLKKTVCLIPFIKKLNQCQNHCQKNYQENKKYIIVY